MNKITPIEKSVFIYSKETEQYLAEGTVLAQFIEQAVHMYLPFYALLLSTAWSTLTSI